MNMQRWIDKHSTTVSDKSGFVIGPFVRVGDLQHLLKSHDVVPKVSRRPHPQCPVCPANPEVQSSVHYGLLAWEGAPVDTKTRTPFHCKQCGHTWWDNWPSAMELP